MPSFHLSMEHDCMENPTLGFEMSSAPGMNPELIEFLGNIEQPSCLNRSDGPPHQRPVPVKSSDPREPLIARLGIDCDDVRQIAGPTATADRKLKSLQEPTHAPLPPSAIRQRLSARNSASHHNSNPCRRSVARQFRFPHFSLVKRRRTIHSGHPIRTTTDRY